MIKYLFYILPLSLALGALTKIEIFPSVNVYLQDLIVFLIISFSLKDIARFFKKRNSFVILFILFSAVSTLGLTFNIYNLFEFGSSISYLVRLGFYFAIIIPMLSFSKSIKSNLKKIMIASGFLFIFLGYIQYFFYPNLRNLYYLGWDEHLYRLFSTFLDPNFAGIFIVLIILFYSSISFRSDLMSRSDLVRRMFYLSGYVFIIPSLFLTYSRSSLISGIIAISIFLFLIGKKKIIFISALIFALLIILLPKDLGGEGVNLLRTYSTGARLVQYNNAIKIFTDHPILGVGFNSLRFVSSRYGFVDQSQTLVSHSGAGIPNSFLVILSTTGVLGFTFFLIFIYKLFKYSQKINDRVYSSAFTAMFSAVLIDSLFENALLFAPIILWMVLSFGVLTLSSKN